MKKFLVPALLSILFIGCKDKAKQVATEVEAETVSKTKEMTVSDKWVVLSIDDWQAFKGGELPEFWKDENGAIVFSSTH